MSEFVLAKKTDMVALADALRELSGGTEELAFPGEMVEAASGGEVHTLTIIPSETVEEITIEHGLGKTPKIASIYFCNDNSYNSSVSTSMIKTHLFSIYIALSDAAKVDVLTYAYSANKLQISENALSSSISVNETTVTFGTRLACNFLSGQEYKVIVA